MAASYELAAGEPCPLPPRTDLTVLRAQLDERATVTAFGSAWITVEKAEGVASRWIDARLEHAETIAGDSKWQNARLVSVITRLRQVLRTPAPDGKPTDFELGWEAAMRHVRDADTEPK